MIGTEPMSFRVLGPLEIRAPGDRLVEVTADKQRRLLTTLLLHANEWVTVEQLIAAVWPDRPPASARGNIKTYVHGLRRLLAPDDRGGGRIDSSAGRYRLNVTGAELDTELFVELMEKSRAAVERGDTAVATDQLRRALDLWHGQPYAPLAGQDAVLAARRLEELRWVARDRLADSLLAGERAAEAVVLLRPLTSEDPLREPTWERLVVALHLAGRRSEALAAYGEARRALVSELGVEPGPQLRQLHQRILAGGAAEPPAQPRTLVRDPKPKARRSWWQRASGRMHHRLRTAILLVAAVCVLTSLAVLAANHTFADPPLLAAEPVSSPSPLILMDSRPADQPARRPLPGWSYPGLHAGPGTEKASTGRTGQVLFGVGPSLAAAAASPLTRQARVSMLSASYQRPADLAAFTGTHRADVDRAYRSGRAINVVVRDSSERRPLRTAYGPACGAVDPLSPSYPEHIRRLAHALAGRATDPPLLITLFGRLEHLTCNADAVGGRFRQDAATTAYFRALKDRFWTLRKIILTEAPNARVAIGWEHWQASFDQPSTGGGLSMFPYFADVLRGSDFMSFEAIDDLSNVVFVKQMVDQLGQYGPVVVTNYGPHRGLVPGVFERDVESLFDAPGMLDQLSNAGLYGFSFTDDQQMRTHPEALVLIRQVVDNRGLALAPGPTTA
ncbi:AfsR/SARP family transcriptional regulator [Fodinicola acaciae]|uniref:AfsR/SARP family transcriptional regulator n=1 Tax=Fodinicola acaciae TaxID=2681555 RepID=UPI0013D13E1E|nr:AfsR/SARP family transcriptional regulator [Fodinicola acaciae]